MRPEKPQKQGEIFTILILLGTVWLANPLRAQDVTSDPGASDSVEMSGIWQAQVDANSIATSEPTAADTAAPDSAGFSNSDGLLPVSSNACVTAPPGLIAWWPGEGNANDIIGGHNGTLANGAGFAAGKVGLAFSFNGSNQAVAIPFLTNLFCTNFSVESWINPAGQVVEPVINQKVIFGQSFGFVQMVVRTGTVGIRPVFQFGTSQSTFYEVDSTIEIPIGQWSHLVGTWDGRTLSIYINGALNAQSVPGTVPVPSTCPIWIGGFDTTDPGGCHYVGQFFNGMIDEVSFYNRALTAAEVLALYNAGSGGKCTPSNSNCVAPPSGLVGWWRGEINALDSALTNNGIAQGMTYSTGEVGQAFSFSGSGSSYVRVPASSSIDVGQGNGFTLELWCNPPSTNETVVTLAEWNNGSGALTGIGCHLEFYSAGRILGDIVDPNTGNDHFVETAGGDVTPNVWQHVAMTYDRTTGILTLYRNGVALTNGNVGIWKSSTSFDLYFGIRAAGVFAPIPYTGLLDEISLYNRVLSPSEIQAIYNADSAGKCVSGVACTPPPSGLISWWRGEGNPLDSTTNHNDLVPAAGTSYGAGEVGQTLSFNGTTSSAIAPASSSQAVQSFTLEGWIYPSNTLYSPVIEYGTNGSLAGPHLWVNGYGLTSSPGALFGNVRNPDFEAFTAANVVPANQWTHVAMVYDSIAHTLILYRNGALVASHAGGPTNLPPTSMPVNLGYRPSGSSEAMAGTRFSGRLDEMSIYNRALTAAEIQAIYNADGAGKCAPAGGVPPTITSQPANLSVMQGSNATFSVTATGTTPLSYQWFFNSNSLLVGKTNATLTLTNVQPAQQGNYSVTVTNAFGKVVSSNAFLTVLPPPVCVPPPSGIVAWWRAESNTVDSIGINDGVPQASQNPVMLYTTGKVGTAWQFTGTTYLQVPASGDLNVGPGVGLTVEGWIRPASTATTQPLLEWSDARNVGVGLVLNFNNAPGTLAAHFTDTNNSPIPILPRRVVLRSTNSVITNGVWQHVALTFDRLSGRATLYVNGRSVGQTNLGVFTPLTQGPVYIGNGPVLNPPIPPFPGSRFTGAMDEFSIYNRALSATEIQSIVTADTAGKCPPPPPPCTAAPAGIVAWWRGQSNTLDSIDTHNGFITNVVVYTNGEVGKGFQFNTGFIRVPASSNLDLGTGPGLSVELWVKPALWNAQPFVEWNSGKGTQGVYLAYGPLVGTLEAGLVSTNGATNVLRSLPNLVGAGAWVHLAVTYDKSSGIAELYYNGSQVASNNFGSFTPRTSTDLYLGYRPPGNYSGSGSRFTGVMDEVSLYSRALTSSEIRSIVATRNTGKCTDAPFIITQPVSQRVTRNFSATFSVTAGGTPNLHYQWNFIGRPIPGATGTSFTLASVQPSNAGPYSVFITNAFGSILSSNAVLTVNLPPVPMITVSPLANFPCNTNLFVIAACGPSALVAFDGSKSYDPDDPTFGYSWYEGTNRFSTNVVATNLLALGSHQITLFVDDHVLGGTNSTTVTVQIISLAQAVNLMIDFVNCSGVSHAQPLLASLNAAADSFGRGNNTSGVNQLGAFENKVQAQVMPGNPGLAASFLQVTQQILDALSRCDSTRIPHGQIVSLARHQDGKMHIKLAGNSASVQLVEASTNLVDWVAVGTATLNTDGTYEFEDGNAVNLPYRFYRVVPLQGQ